MFKTNMELMITLLTYSLNFAWWFFFAFGVNWGEVETYSYIWGLPEWFFYSCIAGFGFCIFTIGVSVVFFFEKETQ